jgi:hypothetical protein
VSPANKHETKNDNTTTTSTSTTTTTTTAATYSKISKHNPRQDLPLLFLFV